MYCLQVLPSGSFNTRDTWICDLLPWYDWNDFENGKKHYSVIIKMQHNSYRFWCIIPKRFITYTLYQKDSLHMHRAKWIYYVCIIPKGFITCALYQKDPLHMHYTKKIHYIGIIPKGFITYASYQKDSLHRHYAKRTHYIGIMPKGFLT